MQTQARQERELTPAERAEIKAERLSQYGELLGLDSDFLADVARRGQIAIIDRAETVDEAGAHATLLAMTQIVGTVMQQKMQRGQRVQQGVIEDAAWKAGALFGVPGPMAVSLVGATLDVFQEGVDRLSQGMPGEENAATGPKTTE